MKTRDRILQTSLFLFNDEGEQNVTTIDVANEMDISPGNLYYHFRGKGVIIESLFNDFEAQMNSILCAPVETPLNVQDHWFYLYVLLEEIYKFRFLYLNLNDILQRNPSLHKRFDVLVKRKKQATKQLLKELVVKEAITASAQDIERLVDTTVLTLIYWLPYNKLNHLEGDMSSCIHRGVYQIMSLVGPYFGNDQLSFYAACQDLYEAVISEK